MLKSWARLVRMAADQLTKRAFVVSAALAGRTAQASRHMRGRVKRQPRRHSQGCCLRVKMERMCIDMSRNQASQEASDEPQLQARTGIGIGQC